MTQEQMRAEWRRLYCEALWTEQRIAEHFKVPVEEVHRWTNREEWQGAGTDRRKRRWTPEQRALVAERARVRRENRAAMVSGHA